MDLPAQYIGIVQHVEDRGEPGVEYSAVNNDCDLHGGNVILYVVPPTQGSQAAAVDSLCAGKPAARERETLA